MGKKAFISKKNATKYDLVFRPSTDPDAAPEREWVESTRGVGIGRPDAERLAQQTHADALGGGRFPAGHPLAWLHEPPKPPLSEARRREIIALGFPDDGYDYLQHMRRGAAAQAEEPAAPGGTAEEASQVEAAYAGPSVYIPAPSFEAPPEDYKAIDASRLTIHQVADTDDDAMLVAGGAATMARELHTVRKRYQEELEQVEALMRQFEGLEGAEAAGDGDEALLEDFLLTATEAGQSVRFADVADAQQQPQRAPSEPARAPEQEEAAAPSEIGGSSGDSSADGWAPPAPGAGARRPPSEGGGSFASTYWRPERTDRNEALSAIDERFEQLALEYDSDEIGSLDGGGSEGPHARTRGGATTDQFTKIMDGFLAQHATRMHAHEGGIAYRPPVAAAAGEETKERLRCMEEAEAIGPAGEAAEGGPPLPEGRRREAWDCESVLSTRSTAYNHPARLDARPARPQQAPTAAARGQIRLSQKTGLPVAEPAAATGRTAASLLPARRPGESAEEKRQRKEAVKDAKRQARAAKKDLKQMFKEEAAKQRQAAAPAVSTMRIA